MNGVILLHKPPGLTSFQALSALKKRLDEKRIGHAGTLDRFAAGLLIAAAGRHTRLLGLFMAEEKEYRAEAVFGEGTDTLDPEGERTGTGPVPSGEDLAAVLTRFRGLIRQRPPAYSAVRVGGKRSSQLARRGRTVELEERPVRIDLLELEAYHPPRAVLKVVCSKGTYIRALARDIASALGTQAHLSTLTRTRIGGFRLEEAVTPQDFDPARHLLTPEALLPRLTGIGRAVLKPGEEGRIRQGQALHDGLFEHPPEEGRHAVLSAAGELLAVVRRGTGAYAYELVLGE